MSDPIRKAVVRGTTVENIILADDDFAPPDGCTLVADDGTAQIGGTCTDGVFAPPAPAPVVVPSSVAMAQLRLALLDAGKLDAVPAAIAGLASPNDSKAQIWWDCRSTVERENASLLLIAPALGLDAAGLDAVFVNAATK